MMLLCGAGCAISSAGQLRSRAILTIRFIRLRSAPCIRSSLGIQIFSTRAALLPVAKHKQSGYLEGLSGALGSRAAADYVYYLKSTAAWRTLHACSVHVLIYWRLSPPH